MKPDNTIIEKPQCGRCNEGDAIIMWGPMWVCGKCALELNEKKIKQDMIFIMEKNG